MIDKLTELEQLYGGRLTPNGMIDHDYKNDKVRFLRFAGAHCPICGKNHWCQINVTGTKVVCQNIATISNDNEIINGFRYLYTIEKINGKLFELVDSNRSIEYDPSIYKTVPTFKLASPKALDIMNRLVLTAYSLNSSHKRNLLDRGLTKDQITLHGSRGFGSFYFKNDKDQDYFKQVKSVKDNTGDLHILSRWTHALKKLKLPINLWHGVPGFYNFVLKKDNKIFEKVPLFSTSAGSNHPSEGMIVPYWDIYNRVQTFQIRVDNPHKYATNIKVNESLLSGELKIWINSDDRYRAVVYYKKYGQKTISEGSINNQTHIDFDYGVDVMKQTVSFDVKTSNKYLWVSSKNAVDGAQNDGKAPVQVAYNPEIAKLDPNKEDNLKKLKEYIDKPKSIWLTEGGLKGYVAVCNLRKAFTDEQLDKYGRDFLAVAGVSSYNKFLPVLRQLNVNTVTIAYDMDMLENDQVADNYSKLINVLHENGYKVEIAVWNPKIAKGIDDALVAGVPIIISQPK